MGASKLKDSIFSNITMLIMIGMIMQNVIIVIIITSCLDPSRTQALYSSFPVPSSSLLFFSLISCHPYHLQVLSYWSLPGDPQTSCLSFLICILIWIKYFSVLLNIWHTAPLTSHCSLAKVFLLDFGLRIFVAHNFRIIKV